jgi:hypothetical protein
MEAVAADINPAIPKAKTMLIPMACIFGIFSKAATRDILLII